MSFKTDIEIANVTELQEAEEILKKPIEELLKESELILSGEKGESNNNDDKSDDTNIDEKEKETITPIFSEENDVETDENNEGGISYDNTEVQSFNFLQIWSYMT